MNFEHPQIAKETLDFINRIERYIDKEDLNKAISLTTLMSDKTSDELDMLMKIYSELDKRNIIQKDESFASNNERLETEVGHHKSALVWHKFIIKDYEKLYSLKTQAESILKEIEQIRTSEKLTYKDLTIYPSLQLLKYKSKEVRINHFHRGINLLIYLMKNQHRLITYPEIKKELGIITSEGINSSVKQYKASLEDELVKLKLTRTEAKEIKKYIITRRGLGYILI